MEQRSTFTLRELCHVLFKRKWLIVVFFLSTLTTVGTAALVLEEPRYEASTQILLLAGREHMSNIALPAAGAGAPMRLNFDLEDQAARAIELLTGRYLSEQVVRAVGARKLCHDPPHRMLRPLSESYCESGLSEQALTDRVVARVQRKISAQRVGNSALVSLSFRDEDPALAAQVVNMLGSLYLERYLGVLQNPRSEAFLQEQFAAAKERLSKAEGDLEAFRTKNGISSTIKDEREIAVRQLTALQGEVGETTGREADVSSRIAQLKDVLAKHGTLNTRVQDELQRNETELNGVRARRGTQGFKLGQVQGKVKRLDSLEPEFDRLQQRVELERQNYRLYMTRVEEARISNAMDSEKISSFKIVEPARIPVEPMKSKLELKLLLAALFGAMGGLIIAFGLEFFADRLETAERAESVLDVPVLVSIPSLRLNK